MGQSKSTVVNQTDARTFQYGDNDSNMHETGSVSTAATASPTVSPTTTVTTSEGVNFLPSGKVGTKASGIFSLLRRGASFVNTKILGQRDTADPDHIKFIDSAEAGNADYASSKAKWVVNDVRTIGQGVHKSVTMLATMAARMKNMFVGRGHSNLHSMPINSQQDVQMRPGDADALSAIHIGVAKAMQSPPQSSGDIKFNTNNIPTQHSHVQGALNGLQHVVDHSTMPTGDGRGAAHLGELRRAAVRHEDRLDKTCFPCYLFTTDEFIRYHPRFADLNPYVDEYVFRRTTHLSLQSAKRREEKLARRSIVIEDWYKNPDNSDISDSLMSSGLSEKAIAVDCLFLMDYEEVSNSRNLIDMIAANVELMSIVMEMVRGVAPSVKWSSNIYEVIIWQFPRAVMQLKAGRSLDRVVLALKFCEYLALLSVSPRAQRAREVAGFDRAYEYAMQRMNEPDLRHHYGAGATASDGPAPSFGGNLS